MEVSTTETINGTDNIESRTTEVKQAEDERLENNLVTHLNDCQDVDSTAIDKQMIFESSKMINNEEETKQNEFDNDVTKQNGVGVSSGRTVNTNEAEDVNNKKVQPEKTLTTSRPENTKPTGSLGLLSQYLSSSDDSCSEDDDDDTDSSETDSDSSNVLRISENIIPTETNLDTLAKTILDNVTLQENYRAVDVDTSESDSDDSDLECIGNEPAQVIDITNDEGLHEFLDNCENSAPQGPIKAKGELRIEDLPPIEELTITVSESECVELGCIMSVVDALVLVESLPNFAAVDIDTVLFLDKGNRTLGQVFDVMGNVASPMYCVRFNNAQDIKNKNITAGSKVYVAPQTEYTNFIVISDLMNRKGCDASWENDHEAPDECNDFSDDEEERLARRKNNQKQRNRNRTTESDSRLPNKVQIKNEPSTSNGYANRGNKSQFNRSETNKANVTTKFYKDNRGYNTRPDNYYQQQMLTHQHNYSWHTAASHGMIRPNAGHNNPQQNMQYASPPPPPPNSYFYPNPFAMQTNQINHGPFSLQAFPPLPPPMKKSHPFHQ